jgi:hypothetical protein
VSKLNPMGTALLYSTYLGGSSDDLNYGIAVDAAGDAYVTGTTASRDFPTTSSAVQLHFGVATDAFVSKLNPTGTALLYSTYLGGSGDDAGIGIAVDAAGNTYVTGDTHSRDFPTTSGAVQPHSRGVDNAFVAKLFSELVACTNTITGSHEALIVQSGGTTCLDNARISGALSVQPGARLFVNHSSIDGAIVANGPAFFGLCDAAITSSVSVREATGFVLVGDPTDDACGGNIISGAVVLQNNHSGVEVAANHVGGSVVANGTSGTGLFPEDKGTEIEGNVIRGALSCSDNDPVPTNDGQPNSVTGAKSGQCASL